MGGRAAAVAVVLGTAAAAWGAGLAGPAPACAAVGEGPNRAVVVVQTSGRADAPVTRVCVRFTEEWLSGAEVLRRADVDAVFKSYGAMGEFVCSILGVGPAVEDCPSPRQNWTYFRAVYPSTTFRYSNTGVAATRVYDGDVEGWRFASSPPPYASVVEVCGGPEPVARPAAESGPTTTAGPAPTTSPPTTTGGAVPPPAAAPAPPPTTAAPAARPPDRGRSPEATSTTVAAGEGTAAPLTETTAAARREEAAPAAPADAPARGRGAPAGAVALFGAVLAGLAGWWWRARTR